MAYVPFKNSLGIKLVQTILHVTVYLYICLLNNSIKTNIYICTCSMMLSDKRRVYVLDVAQA